MSAYEPYFKGKKITVVGLGLLGGVGDIRFLAQSGANLTVTDLKREEELQPSLDVLKEFSNIHYTLGRHDIADFENRDLIIKAPAMPLDSPYIKHAKEQGIPVTMWASLFARFAADVGSTVVGITGTRGKTTTAAMVAAIISASGVHPIEGGNVPGTSMLPHLSELSKDAIVVLELDSWKLQGFREEKLSPHIAVFTTFYPDHLDYYRAEMNAYLADKVEIFLHQHPEDFLILGEQCVGIVMEKYSDQIHSHVTIAQGGDIPNEWTLRIPGLHNRENAACARAVAGVLGISDSIVRVVLERFEGVPGRLQLVRDTRGIKIYNDTTSTTPQATIAALRALDPQAQKNILLIAGGADKGIDIASLVPEIKKYCKSIMLLEGSGTVHLRREFPEAPLFHSLLPALDAALTAAKPNDIILLSPGFASFGMFKNEYDRGEQFVKLVQGLT